MIVGYLCVGVGGVLLGIVGVYAARLLIEERRRRNVNICTKAPRGWYCPLPKHYGPCASIPRLWNLRGWWQFIRSVR